jgi:hypothetical protein
MIAEKCWPCIAGLHEECYDPQMIEENAIEAGIEGEWTTCCCSINREPDAAAFVGAVGRPMLDPDQITDPKSTGRKRAAMLYPIYEGMECEWAWLRYAGGGVVPVVGCRGNTITDKKGGDDENKQGDRHHGPSKATINNAPDNVHRICSVCHTHWHVANDKFYTSPRPPADQQWFPNVPYFMHDSITTATDEELEQSEAYWAVKNHGAYPFTVPAAELRVEN